MKHTLNHIPAHRAFTLVEMLVASTIAVLIAASTIGLLNSLTGARSRIEQEMALQQEARAAGRALESALRNAIQTTADKNDWLLQGVDETLGPMPNDSIRFRTLSLRPLRADQPESDWREVEFFIMPPQQADQPPALMRRLDPTLNLQPDDGGILERIANNIAGLDIQYHDGIEWLEEWPIENTQWPLAIRFNILIIAGDPEQPITATTRRTISYFIPSESTDEDATATDSGGGGRS